MSEGSTDRKTPSVSVTVDPKPLNDLIAQLEIERTRRLELEKKLEEYSSMKEKLEQEITEKENLKSKLEIVAEKALMDKAHKLNVKTQGLTQEEVIGAIKSKELESAHGAGTIPLSNQLNRGEEGGYDSYEEMFLDLHAREKSNVRGEREEAKKVLDELTRRAVKVADKGNIVYEMPEGTTLKDMVNAKLEGLKRKMIERKSG